MYTNPHDDQSVEEDAVENEQISDESSDEITMPFSPEKIDIDISTINLGSLITDIEDDDIDFGVDFQRSSDIWSKIQKSRLIESILLGLPLPSFYFSEDPVTKKKAIIDGLQRISAISDFVIKKELCLQKLQFLHNFNGKYYDDLPRQDQRRIDRLKITINTLRKETPKDVKYVIFQRVNTAGVPLEAQEMRHALNQGEAAEFIKRLSQVQSFVDATDGSVSGKRMQDRDFANRFIAFYLGYNDYEGDLDIFLNSKMSQLNDISNDERNNLSRVFDESMQCCYSLFKEHCFRKKFEGDTKRKPISKALFDTLSVNVAWLTSSQRKKLVTRAECVSQSMLNLFKDENFLKSITSGTGHKSTVNYRFERVKEMLNSILEDDHDN